MRGWNTTVGEGVIFHGKSSHVDRSTVHQQSEYFFVYLSCSLVV